MRLARPALPALRALLLAAALIAVPVGGISRTDGVRRERAAQPACAKADAPACRPLPCTFVRPLLRPEQAPPLDDPRALPAGAAPLGGGELVMGLELEGKTRAYPLNLLRYHRVINDELAGRAVAIIHSPLSGASLCLDRTGLGHLRHSGSLLEGDELIADGVGRLWSPLLGRPLGDDGARPVPALRCPIMRWSAWRRLHANSQLAWPRRAVLGFDYRRDPWAWYRRDPYYLVAPVHYLDLRWPHKQEVLGVVVEGEARAYPLPPAGRRVLNTSTRGRPIVVVLDAGRGFAAAYDRRLPDCTVELDPELRDRSGSRFNLLGEAVSGPLAGRRLRTVDGGRALFFAWAAYHNRSMTRGDHAY